MSELTNPKGKKKQRVVQGLNSYNKIINVMNISQCNYFN